MSLLRNNGQNNGNCIAKAAPKQNSDWLSEFSF